MSWLVFVTAFSMEMIDTLKLFSVKFGDPEIIQRSSRVFFIFCAKRSLRVLLTICGIGIANCAMTTQSVIDFIREKHKINPRISEPNIIGLIFIGIAGNLNSSFKIGDIVLSKNWIFPQNQKFLRFNSKKGKFEDQPGSLPPLERVKNPVTGEISNFLIPTCNTCNSNDPKISQSIYPSYIRENPVFFDNFAITIKTNVFTESLDAFKIPLTQKLLFPVNEELLNLMKDIIDSELVKGRMVKVNGKYPEIHCVKVGVSSDTFVDNDEYADYLFETFDASVVDTESTSFVQTCLSNGNRCVVIRTLSDLAGRGPSLVSPMIESEILIELVKNLAQINISIVETFDSLGLY